MYVYYYRTYEKAVSGGGERELGSPKLSDDAIGSGRGPTGLHVLFILGGPSRNEQSGGRVGMTENRGQETGHILFIQAEQSNNDHCLLISQLCRLICYLLAFACQLLM